jgi:uncharacterized protein YkwD
LHKLVVAALAAPILAAVYLRTALGRRAAARLGVLFGAGALILVTGAWAFVPGRTTAVPTGAEPTALPSAEFRTHLATGHALRAPITLEFSAPMSPETVAAALRVTPAIDVELDWDATGTVLTVAPAGSWAPSTYYLVTVDRAAADAAGARLEAAVRAAFLTAAAPTARIEVATAPASAPVTGEPASETAAVATRGSARVPLDARFVVTVNGAVDPAALESAVVVAPAVAGTAVASVEAVPAPGVAPISRVVFTPTEALAPDTEYTISLAPALTDHEGSVVTAEPLVVRTIGAPSVVRFRPVGAATEVAVDANVSVRFDRAMDRAATQAAFTATADGKPVTGEYAWFEGDTVLVLDPAADLPRGVRVVLAVGAGARSVDGLAVRAPKSVSFTTVAPPPPAPTPRPVTSTPRPTTPPSTGGGSVGGGSWAAVETYMLSLLNCNRQGGIVTSTGACSSPGGSGRAALKLDSGISSKVARPYAKLLATRGICSHFADGNPGDRLRRAGYTNYTWAENIGCPNYSDARRGALRTELFFQSERSYNGGHWRNLMDPKFDRVGIGIWVAGGRTRIVIDFYHP